MNQAEYISLLNDPNAIDQRQTDALEKIVAEFPYFQSARALRLKGLYSQNSFQYNYALKVTAAYTTDRSVLFDFITSDTFTTIQGRFEDNPETPESAVSQDTSHKMPSGADELAKQSILTSIREASGGSQPADQTVLDDSKLKKTDGKDIDVQTIEAKTPVEVNTETITQADAGEFVPPIDELQFLPEALAPIEFVPVAFQTPADQDDQVSTAGNVADDEIKNPVETARFESEAVFETPAQTDSNEPHGLNDASAPVTDVQAPGSIVRDTALVSETKLEIGKPLEFTKSETHSFSEWLQLTKIKPIVRDQATVIESQNDAGDTVVQTKADLAPDEEQTTADKISKTELIDRFIETNPKIPKITKELRPAVAAEAKDDHSSLMTETLARVYLEQKKYQKAIQAYEILILKYPEKSSFFADRISEIKNLQQNNIL